MCRHITYSKPPDTNFQFNNGYKFNTNIIKLFSDLDAQAKFTAGLHEQERSRARPPRSRSLPRRRRSLDARRSARCTISDSPTSPPTALFPRSEMLQLWLCNNLSKSANSMSISTHPAPWRDGCCCVVNAHEECVVVEEDRIFSCLMQCLYW